MTAHTGGVVAIVPAMDSEDTIRATVEALHSSPEVDDVVVVDDGSSDNTARVAAMAGARVVRLPVNVGKGGAVASGIAAAPTADAYLLVDADTGASAAAVIALLAPLRAGEADVVIGVLPSAGGRGGFGLVKRAARWAIASACGFDASSPLSGQRAVRGDLLRRLDLAPRFGLEVAMTIDAVRAGARVLERDVVMEHRHRGRKLDGFVHRGGQGLDAARAAWTRLVPRRGRLAVILTLTLAAIAMAVVASGRNSAPIGEPLALDPSARIVLVPGLEWDAVPVDATGAMASVAGNGGPVAGVDPRVTTSPAFPNAVRPGDVIVGTATAEGAPRLRPLIVAGPSGTLTSLSTRRPGLVAAGDVAAMIEDAGDRKIRVMHGDRGRETAAGIAEVDSFYERVRPWFISAYAVFQVVVFGMALSLRRTGKPAPRRLTLLGLAVAAVPAANYVVRALHGTDPPRVALWSALVAVAVGMIVVMSDRVARSAAGALSTILLATIAIIAGDVLTGSRLQLSGIFGSPPSLGARYHGLGNPASAVLLFAAVAWSALHVHRAWHRRAAVGRVAALFAVLAAIVGLPGLGSDVGGLIAFGVTAVVAVAAFAQVRPSLYVAAGASLAGVVALVAAAVIDLGRPPESRTHLGDLAARMTDDGWAPLVEIVGRKIEANLFGYAFPWSLVAVAADVALLAVFAGGRRWTGAFPPGSSVRSGAAVFMAAGLLSYALNDSGIVVLLLTGVFLGPLLIVQAYRSQSPILEVSQP